MKSQTKNAPSNSLTLPKKTSSFEQLPGELILLIFEQLSPVATLSLTNTSKFFRVFRTDKSVKDKKIAILDPEFFDIYQSLCELKTPRRILGISFERKKNQALHRVERLLASVNKQTTKEKQILRLKALTSASYFTAQLLHHYLFNTAYPNQSPKLSIELHTILVIFSLKHALDIYTPDIHYDKVGYQYNFTLANIFSLSILLGKLGVTSKPPSTAIKQAITALQTSLIQFTQAVSKMDEESKAAISYEMTEKPPWNLNLETIIDNIILSIKKYPSFGALDNPLDTSCVILFNNILYALSTGRKIDVITQRLLTLWDQPTIKALCQTPSVQAQLLSYTYSSNLAFHLLQKTIEIAKDENEAVSIAAQVFKKQYDFNAKILILLRFGPDKIPLDLEPLRNLHTNPPLNAGIQGRLQNFLEIMSEGSQSLSLQH